MRTFLIACIILVVGAVDARADSLDQLAQKLVTLRGEVEAVQTQLDEMKASHNSRLRSLANQRAELEGALRREELTAQRLQRAVETARKRVRDGGEQHRDLSPLLNETITQLRNHVDTGLPFQRQERRAVLDEIERQLASRVLTPTRGLNRLWAFYEDEIRLATENGLHRQAIDLGGHRVLANVVRLGMVMLFFRADDRLGYALERDGQWSFHQTDDKADREQIATLFDSFEKQVRTGYFEIPNPRVEENQ